MPTLDVSVVIPVFNSEAVLARTVADVLSVLRGMDRPFEVVLVDDGSADGSWHVASGLAAEHAEVVALRLLRNYGQHNANLAGFRQARGTWLVTMDDDGQNPADQIPLLLETAAAGSHDVVFGRFEAKQASRVRGVGSRVVGWMNRRIFGKPDDLVVSNFRALHRDVVDRICADATRYPYITGQALLYSHNPGNALVRHETRAVGESNYNAIRIARLLARILFSYSVIPLHAMAVVGLGVALLSFLAGGVYLLRGAVGDVRVEGWTTLVVLLSFLQGVVLLMLSMLGEYVIRTLNQVSDRPTYQVREVVDDG